MSLFSSPQCLLTCVCPPVEQIPLQELGLQNKVGLLNISCSNKQHTPHTLFEASATVPCRLELSKQSAKACLVVGQVALAGAGISQLKRNAQSACRQIVKPKSLNFCKVCREPGLTYTHIHEDDRMSIGIFCLEQGATIPFHNHPGMVVLSR